MDEDNYEHLISETNSLANTLLAQIITKETKHLKSQLISSFDSNLQTQKNAVNQYIEQTKSVKSLRCGVVHSANVQIENISPGLVISIFQQNHMKINPCFSNSSTLITSNSPLKTQKRF